MFGLKRNVSVEYDDLLRELEGLSQQVLLENSSIAMDMMVLESKLRARFNRFERALRGENPLDRSEENLSIEQWEALIPKDVPPFPSLYEIRNERKRNRIVRTAGTAALLAIGTALGVFGLASLLQVGLSWLA